MNSDKKTLTAPTPGLLVDRPVASTPSQPSFPGRFLRRVRNLDRIFICSVILPTVLAGLYYGFMASDIYVSDSSFVVESVQDQGGTSSSLSSLLKTASSGASDQDTASVQEFMQSRDALQTLQKEMDMRNAFGSDKVDALARFGGVFWWDKSFESLYLYYSKKVLSINESEVSSSISELKVNAFSPQEAYLINRKLLEMGEKLVNTLNDRLQQDLVHYAEAKVEEAGKRLEGAYVALTAYLSAHKLVDPGKQSDKQLELGLRLEENLIDAQNQLIQLSSASVNNPGIPALETKVKNLEAQIEQEKAKTTGAETSLTGMASDYDKLIFERDFAQKQLSEAMGYLEKSRNDAQRKQLYLERIVEPNKPDVAVEPRGLRNTIYTLALGLVTWGIITLFAAGVREHQQ